MTNVYFRMIEPEKDQHEPYTKSNKHISEQTERKNWWKADDLTSNHQKKTKDSYKLFLNTDNLQMSFIWFGFLYRKIFRKNR